MKRAPHNPAFLNPDELQALGLKTGDRIEISSEHGKIEAVVQVDKALRPGVVSISHCWGGLPDKAGPGVNVNLLISCETDDGALLLTGAKTACTCDLCRDRDPAARFQHVNEIVQALLPSSTSGRTCEPV